MDEVARAKGHDYMTVIYDMVSGHLIGVETGRTAEVFSNSLKRLAPEVATKIAAVAIWVLRIRNQSVIVCPMLTPFLTVFDPFHVMQNYCKAIVNATPKPRLFAAEFNAGCRPLSGLGYLTQIKTQSDHQMLDRLNHPFAMD
ncbi:MAG: transposase [Pseudomonadales bacterium]|nr:transposase [Pseudomonadales bacterium]